MRIAYVVVAHKNSEQVVRLVRRLATDQATFVVHVDRKASATVDANIRSGTRAVADVHFVKRDRCFWGGFGMVRAVLRSIDYIIDQEVPFEYVVLLSGQDYPLRSPGEIELFLRNSGGRSFMQVARLPTPFWQEGGLPRIEKVHLISYGRLRFHLRVPWRRQIPGGLTPYGGEAWWCFARPVVQYIHEFVECHRPFVRFFHHVLHPDEVFFQTIVMNSPLADSVVDDHLRYVDWSTDPGPAVLRASDFEKLTHSAKLFARKFDETMDSEILDLLDNRLDTLQTGGHSGWQADENDSEVESPT
jgi:hypothetical protein